MTLKGTLFAPLNSFTGTTICMRSGRDWAPFQFSSPFVPPFIYSKFFSLLLCPVHYVRDVLVSLLVKMVLVLGTSMYVSTGRIKKQNGIRVSLTRVLNQQRNKQWNTFIRQWGHEMFCTIRDYHSSFEQQLWVIQCLSRDYIYLSAAQCQAFNFKVR